MTAKFWPQEIVQVSTLGTSSLVVFALFGQLFYRVYQHIHAPTHEFKSI